MMIIVDPSQIILIGIISTFIHELGHIWAMKIYGHNIRKINIGFFCLDIVSDKSIESIYKNIPILLSGSVFNLAISFLCSILYFITNIQIFKTTAYINICIGILNLLPISSLDGGQIFYIMLSKFFSYNSTKIICEIISFIFLFPLSIVSFLILLKSKYNFSLLFICCYLVYTILSKKYA